MTEPRTFYNVDEQTVRAYLESLEAHIRYVQEAGRRLGVPEEQLAIHDQSKYSQEEFPGYARHFHGQVSPEDRPAVTDGFVRAWLHHIHANPHHWQHWIFPDGYAPGLSSVEKGVVEMPTRYALEMVADWMGASRTYTGLWDMTDWLWKNMPKIRVHSKTAAYLREVLDFRGYADVVYVRRFAQETL